MVAVLRPKVLVRHDVFDGYSVNPHHRRDPIAKFAKHHAGADDLEAELQGAIDHIDETTPKDSVNVIVASNHTDFLIRWLKDMDPKDDPRNAIVYHELMAACLRAAKMSPAGVKGIDPFAHWVAPRLKSKARFLSRTEHYVIKGIVLQLHGDDGPNGSRGTPTGYSKLGAKTVIGHSHAPGIYWGCYQVGTSTPLRLEYNRGPSSWFNTHCFVWPNGKRQLVHLVKGKWRA